MLERGPDLPHARDPYRYLRKIRSLEDYIENSNLKSQIDASLLHYLQACYDGNDLAAVALVDSQNSRGDCLTLGLSIAVACGHIKVARVLLREGVKIDESYIEKAQSIPMCELLVKHGLNFTSLGPDRYPLLNAVLVKNEPLTEWLITHGARPSSTTIEVLAMYSTPEVMTLFLKFNVVDMSSVAPLHAAAGQEPSDVRLRMVQYFLNMGIDPNMKALDLCGLRLHFALRYADKWGLTSVVRCLLEAGADPFLEDRFGRTPYDHAVRRGRQDLVMKYMRYKKPAAAGEEVVSDPLYIAARPFLED